MNDIPDSSLSNAPLGQANPQNALTSEQCAEFCKALDILYIRNNLSGRLKFLESWPVAGKLIFGDELIGFDHEGTSDLERRSVLEEDAEMRRLELLDIAQTFEVNSVEKSVLQVEYVENLVQKLGRDLALLLYASNIVDRFIPPPPEPVIAEDAVSGDDVSQDSTNVSNDPLQSEQSDVEAALSDIVPDTPQAGAPSASNPIVDLPDPPKNPAPMNPEEAVQANLPDPFEAEKSTIRKPVVPDIDDNLDAVEPISVEPPPQRPVPEDIREEVAAQNPEALAQPQDSIEQTQSTEPTRPPLPKEPTRPPLPDGDAGNENVFLGRDPYAREEPQAPPPPSPSSPPASPDPVQQDVSSAGVHKALDGSEPIASQKMTFMPSKKPEDSKPTIPVIGGDQDKSQD